MLFKNGFFGLLFNYSVEFLSELFDYKLLLCKLFRFWFIYIFQSKAKTHDMMKTKYKSKKTSQIYLKSSRFLLLVCQMCGMMRMRKREIEGEGGVGLFLVRFS